VANVVVQVAFPDKWEWLPDPIIGYTVGGAYHLLTHLYSRETSTHSDLIWNKFVPSKVSFLLGGLSMTGYPQSLIFLLVVVYVMIPCYVPLDAMLLRISIICFCTVPFWSGIISWFGITWVSPDDAISVASQFCGAYGFCKNIRTNLQAIWLASIWSI
jgi:hypothetical protein